MRIVQLENRDTDLGTENPATQNAGAVELWRDGARIAEFTWWEKDTTDLATLAPARELHGHLTYDADFHIGFARLRARA